MLRMLKVTIINVQRFANAGGVELQYRQKSYQIKVGKTESRGGSWQIFALPVSCALCRKFISEKVKNLAAKEVEHDKRRKMEEGPIWIPRDWESLRDVVQKSWE